MTDKDLNYPKHKHPHGVEDKPENPERIWVCEECQCIFTDTEIREQQKGWGHFCKRRNHKTDEYCESHLEPYKPDMVSK